jgi:uncharacterized membrane protein HdeD (DUF308 family)
MFTVLGRNWWLLALRGVLAIAFGILAFLMPGITLAVLVALVGAYLLVDGAAMLVALVRGDPEARRSAWSVGIMGVLGIVAGIGTFLLPDITALTLLYLTAAWAIVMGVFQVIGAISLRREIEGEFWLALGGVISILFGALLVINPGAGLLSLAWLVGLWAIMFGIANFVLAWRLRELAQRSNGIRGATGPSGAAGA